MAHLFDRDAGLVSTLKWNQAIQDRIVARDRISKTARNSTDISRGWKASRIDSSRTACSFVGGGPEFFPVALPLRAVEDGGKCPVSESGTVAKLVALMSALKYSQGDLTGIRPVLEIRFYRAGHASERPVLEGFFDLGFGNGAFKEGAVMMAAVNGRLVLVDYKHLGMLEDFAAELTVPPENKVCEASENK